MPKKSLNSLHAHRELLDIPQVALLPFGLQHSNGFISLTDHHKAIHQFRHTIENQLEILRISLDVSSVVLLWVGPTKTQLLNYAHSSIYPDLLSGPFDCAAGIIGGLRENIDLAFSPYRPGSPAIPYYSSAAHTGSFYAQTISIEGIDSHEKVGILCVDRSLKEQWTQAERSLISLTREQITSALVLSRDHLFADFERQTLQQVFNGIRILNSALDSDSVYAAAVQALGHVVEADVVAIGSIHKDFLDLNFLSTQSVAELSQARFPLEDSIVGQVVKYRRTLPETGDSSGAAQVINGFSFYDRFRSVQVVPLFQEDGPVTKVMIVAAEKKDQLPRNCRDMIEMVAAQVAIKLDLARAHDQINNMAITDTLTGIANRRAFQRGFSAMYERALRRGSAFSLIIGDIDLFKSINDTFGHPFGDQVIQQVARQLTDVVRVGDLAARIGGEEFAILLEDTDGRGALEVAERLRQKVEGLRLTLQQKRVPVTISLGVAAFPRDTEDQEKLFSCADQALYQAKESGRNRSVRWGTL
ncbi:MAG: sensor domain-containing diguanylate cyclase [Deltaproteobacteria bacterium]|nr:sensor domain-containing diguanylate cyclase [Deltaproteobacteria bacterium]